MTEGTQGFPTRFPRDLYERLRQAAHDQRVPMNTIVVRATERELVAEASADWGDVTDYKTGAFKRAATREEWQLTASRCAAGDVTGTWLDHDGIAVYVDGGPETPMKENPDA